MRKGVLSLLLLAVATAQERTAPATAAPGRGSVPPPAPAVGAAGGVPSPKDLKYPPLRPLQAPNAATFTLANGMKLYLLEDHDLPMVSGLALVRTGSLWDPRERVGLAQLVGITMRTGGTSVKTGEQVDALLDNVAANVEFGINDSQGTFSFTGLKEDAPATLQLFKELLTRPAFREDSLEFAKAQLRAAIPHRNDDGRSIARREFARLIYGKDSPLGWQQEYATIGRISRSDLGAFHQRYFVPANVMLGLYGDFRTEEMKAWLEKLFADWTTTQPPVPEPAMPKNTPSPGIFLAEKKDVVQTYFAIGQAGGARDDKDYAAREILAGVLGGGPKGRIAEHLRTRLGIASEIGVTWDGGYAYPGLFEISGSTKSFSTVPTIQAIREEIERIRTAEVSEEECRSAREAAVHKLVFSNDARAKLFARQMVLELYGYPKDYLPRYQKALEGVTRAEVLRVARQYLDPANLTVAVVANPAMLGDPLAKLGAVTKIDIDIPEARLETAPVSDAGLAAGKQILLLAQTAAGGAARLAAVQDCTITAEYSIDPAVPNAPGSKIVQTDRWVAPTTFRQDATLPIGRVSGYTDGKNGWVATAQGWGPLAGLDRTRTLGELFRVYFRLLLSDRLEGRTVNAIDDTTVQIADINGQAASVEFDPATHLARRMSYDSPQAAGPPLYTEEVFEDYRDVGGIQAPFKVTIARGGRKFADVAVKEYKINTGLNPLEIARRPQ